MAQLWSKPPTTTSTVSPKPPRPLYTFLFVVILCILGFYTLHCAHPAPPLSTSQNALHLLRRRRFFLSTATNSTLSSYLRDLTLHPHLAGTKSSLHAAHYVLNHFTSSGLRAHSVSYDALLSYPTHSSLAAHFSNGTVFSFALTENDAVVVRPYHAYSPSGSAVAAKAVFVNFGREEDYRALGRLGVNVTGCVAMARKGGGMLRSEVVEMAAMNGAATVLLYTERGEGEGFGKGFERGTVMRGLGDPLSPGWAAVEGGERLGIDDDEVSRRFPKIPSLPLSFEDAQVILGSLGGAPAPSEWRDALGYRVDHIGPGPTVVDFDYQGEKKVAKIYNVFAVIRGSGEPDRYVLLGNHRDAWTYGAVDPNSGTAALLDIARRFSLLMRSGWRPRRTIVLCSWDAEEFGMIGSTEWVEQNLVNLGSKAIAYLNVDCAVQGPGFFAGATPQLDNLILEVIKKVEDPDFEGMTMYQKWAARNSENTIERLGRADSDFAAFVQHAGIPSVDMYYGRDFPTYHTAFDSYDWMTNYGDPLFRRHVAIAGVWGLLALHLADDSILPFNYVSYAEQLNSHKEVLSNLLGGIVSLSPLNTSIQEFASAAKEADIEAQKLGEQETAGELVMLKRRALNDRLMLAERCFLDADGLDGRPWFKHLIYGPPSDPESKLDFFPGIADAISRTRRMSLSRKKAIIQHEIWKVARAIQRAASALRGDLT